MKYGIPYMGSKSDIIASIALNLPRAEHFYDLFGGGFCVSHYMLAKKSHWYKNIHYNEIKADVVDLVKRAIAGEFNYNKFKPAWISRDEFNARKATDAYVRLLWSFGNNQKNYLFGSDIESYKKSAHMAVVFDEFDDTSSKVLGFSQWPNNVRTITQKRLYWRQKVVFNNKKLIRGELHRLQQLESMEKLQQLQQLEALERVQQLERLDRLSFSAKDYRDVQILPNSVVYCDIPYKSTANYIDGFDHAAFYEWALTRKFPVYISEYSMPKDFKVIYTIERKTKLSSKGAIAHHDEKLFWNGIRGL